MPAPRFITLEMIASSLLMPEPRFITQNMTAGSLLMPAPRFITQEMIAGSHLMPVFDSTDIHNKGNNSRVALCSPSGVAL